jgi:Universal stress protein family
MKVKATQKNRKVVVELDRKDTATISAVSVHPVHSLFKLKQILVPVDFSECSKKALRYAVPFAKEFEGGDHSDFGGLCSLSRFGL